MPTSRHEHAVVVLNYKLTLILIMALHANSAIHVVGINVLEFRISHCTKIIILAELSSHDAKYMAKSILQGGWEIFFVSSRFFCAAPCIQ